METMELVMHANILTLLLLSAVGLAALKRFLIQYSLKLSHKSKEIPAKFR